MNPGSWSVRNRVAANLLCLVLLAAGLVAASVFIPRAVFPEVSTNFISVTVIDPGSDRPEDVEQLVTRPIEEAVASVRGLRNLISNSQPNGAFVFLEIDASVKNLDPVLNEIRQEVAKVRRKLPASVEEPVVQEVDVPFPLLTLGVSYPASIPETLIRPALKRMERELQLVAGVSAVQVDGLDEREVWIEVNPDKAEALGLPLAEIVAAIDRTNDDWNGGRLRGPGGERIVRVAAEARRVDDFLDIPLRRSGEATLHLRDVAHVTDRSEEDRSRARLNRKPGVTFSLTKQTGADAQKVAEAALATFRKEAASLPAGAEAEVLLNATLAIDIRIDTVLKNGFQALLIISLLLVVFLNWRLAILVAIGLPISLCGVFLVLLLTDRTFDVLSLFGMILALGMLVDDAVVVAENVYRHYEAGMKPLEAAVKGTGEVIVPVIGSVATTVAAFLPLLLGEGMIGKFLFIVPVVVISALTFSILQAFFILPSHLADFVRAPPRVEDLEGQLGIARGLRRRVPLILSIHYWELRRFVDSAFQAVVSIYRHALTLSLRRRYWVTGVFTSMILAAMAAVGSGLIPFRLFDIDFADRIFVKLDLPANASLDQTEEAVARVEEAILSALPQTDVANLLSQIGVRLNESEDFLLQGSNLAMITVDIDEQSPLCRPPSTIVRDLRAVLDGFPQFVRATAEAQQGGPPVGRPVNVLILGEEFEVLEKLAARIRTELEAIPGVHNLATSFDEGRPEVRAVMDPSLAAAFGVSVQDAGLAVAASYGGLESRRMRWGQDEVRVRVVWDEASRRDPERLLAQRVMNRDGDPVALASIARLETTGSLARIPRRDQARVLVVSADIDVRENTSAAVNRILAGKTGEILGAHPGYEIRLAGENEDTDRSLLAMGYASLLAVFLIYSILAVLFNSFTQPLVVMSVIPFGLVGVVGGLLIQGEPLGLMSIMGTIALAGIVVNNSVVFLDFINQFRAENPLVRDGVWDASHYRFDRWFSIYRAGSVRLRPIFLTTITTVAGLWSLAFLTTGQEEFLAPMAQAIVWGLSFATLLTLILVPCLFAILDDLRLIRLKRAAASARSGEEPAADRLPNRGG